MEGSGEQSTRRGHRALIAGGLVLATAAAGTVARGSGTHIAVLLQPANPTHFAAPSAGPITFSGTLDRTAVLRGSDGVVRMELVIASTAPPAAPPARRADRPAGDPRPLRIDGRHQDRAGPCSRSRTGRSARPGRSLRAGHVFQRGRPRHPADDRRRPCARPVARHRCGDQPRRGHQHVERPRSRSRHHRARPRRRPRATCHPGVRRSRQPG